MTSRLSTTTDRHVLEAGARLPPIHPGEILLEEFLRPLGLSQLRLARDIRVTPRRIQEIVHGRRAVTVDIALRLARYFDTSTELWLNLQTSYELDVAEDTVAAEILRTVPVLARPDLAR